MKYLYIGLLVLCLLTAGCWFSQRELGRRTEAVAVPLEQALAAARAGDADSGLRYAGIAALEWERSEGVLASLLSHDHTRRVGAELAALLRSTGDEFRRRGEGLIRSVRELAEMERVIWRNIF